jgi:hypothetical protein
MYVSTSQLMSNTIKEYARNAFKYTANILSGQFIFFVLLCTIQILSTFDLFSQQNNKIENISELDIMALHHIAQNDESTALQLFQHCSQLGIVEYLLKEGSVLSETVLPDYILFFDGTTQKNQFSIIDVSTNNEVQTIEKGNLIAVIVFEDSPNERYNLLLQSSSIPSSSSSFKQLTNVTQVHTNGSPAFTFLIQPKISTTLLPYYYARIEYYRYTQHPIEIRCKAVPLPGFSQHYDNFGFGVSWVWTHQPVTSFEFDPQTSVTTATRENRYEFRGDGMLSFQIFPDRDPREPQKLPWERRYYSNFFSKFGLQGSMGFTRFATYFDHWFLGGTFQLYHKLYLYSGVSFVQLPKVDSPTMLTGNQQFTPDQYMRGDYQRLFFMGITVSVFEF